MTGWSDLRRELDLWAARGETPTLWWRDDDAAEPSADLDRAMALAEAAAVPLALAVIPAENRLTAVDLAGRGHAGPARLCPPQPCRPRRQEERAGCGAPRRSCHCRADDRAGCAGKAFGSAFRPVLVPPWNRLGAHLPPLLPELGYAGLSRFGARDRPAIGAMRIVNTHVDIIDWKGARGFVGVEAALGQAIGHLQARRGGTADPAEATGLLTHHRVHDSGCWDFLEELFAVTAGNGAAEWRSAASLFQPSPPRAADRNRRGAP